MIHSQKKYKNNPVSSIRINTSFPYWPCNSPAPVMSNKNTFFIRTKNLDLQEKEQRQIDDVSFVHQTNTDLPVEQHPLLRSQSRIYPLQLVSPSLHNLWKCMRDLS